MNTVIYARQSLDRDGQGAAVDRQLVECRKLAKKNGLKVAKEYVDNDVSASNGVRPEFTKLLAQIKLGDVSTIIVWHTDRLYRKVRDLVEIVETAEKHSLRILTVRAGDLDLSTPAGRMLAGMLGQVARYEVEQKGARQVAANIQRATAGKWQFSIRPYGYERINGEVVQVPAEAEILREAYSRYIAGETYYSIVQNLNVRNVPTRGGGEWSVSQLRERLTNPAYAGIRLYKGEQVAEGDWEPVISRDTWEEFKSAKKRRHTPHDFSNRTKYLLSGLALCGVCGGRLMARPAYPRRKDGVRAEARMSYACVSKWCVSRDLIRVDDLVERVIIARLSMKDAAALSRPKVELQPLLVKSGNLRQRKDDLASALAEGLLTLSAVRTESMKLDNQLETLQQQISAADGDSQLGELIRSDDIAEHWHNKLTFAQRRAVVGTLMTVTINKQANPRVFDPKDVAIEWLS